MKLDTTNIDLKTLIYIGVIIVSAIIITRITRFLLNKFIDKSSQHLNVDSTKYKFFKNAVTFIIWSLALIGVIYTIPSLRSLAITLFAGAGIFAAILGFASQQAFSNVISGIFIVIFKPFRVGDIIRIGDNYFGEVEDITLRHTVIKSFENTRVIMPNSVISSETVINSNINDQKICRFIELGISYDSDIDMAIKIMREEAMKHPSHIDNRTDKEIQDNLSPVKVKVIGFGDSSVNLRAWVWAEDPINALDMHWDLNKSIKERFDKEGVEIPFPYRTLVYKKDLRQKK